MGAAVRGLLGAVCALALLAAPSQAATVSYALGAVHLGGLPGERNAVIVSPAFDGGVDIRDVVEVRPGFGCVATSRYSAHCAGDILGLEIDLGDADDKLTIEGQLGLSLIVTAGAGNDVIEGSEGADVIDGGLGDDLLLGRQGADGLVGGPGDDRLVGGDGADTLQGAEDADRLEGNGGADTLSGGGGLDAADYSARTRGIDVALDDTAGDGEPGEGDDVRSDVERVLATDAADVLVAGAGGSVLEGRGGEDRIEGGAGADQLVGGGGDDRIAGAAGDDVLDGGDGADRLLGEPGADRLTGGDGDDALGGGDGDDVLRGEAGVDGLIGDAGADDLDGGLGADALSGGSGADVLEGADGDDLLLGDGRLGPPPAAPQGPVDEAPEEDGDDRLSGGDGADRLDGGIGTDAYDAGAGDDAVEAREPSGDAGAETVRCGDGADGAGLDAGDVAEACETVAKPGEPRPEVQVLGASAAAPAPAAGSRGSGSQPPLGIPVLRDGGVLMAVRCTGAEGAPCAVYVDVRALPRRSRGGRSKTTSVARLRTTIPNGRTVLLRAPLSRAGARLVRRSGRVRAVASVLLRPQGGPPRRWSRPLHLVRRGL